ncbi:MAG TPA: propanediol utilization protein [Firmicutes bacterium]|nr:propanediol utilization protein [Bacillota bacterium]
MKENILIEISARHVHVTKEALEILFGSGAELTVKKMLSQPGQFASEQRVDIVGPRNTLKNVSILGPVRKACQVEVSLTDARTLGVDAPIRESGDTANSAPIKIVGPCGELDLSEGLIAAKRHIHLDPKTADELNLKNGEIVSVEVPSPLARSLTFSDVVIRVNENFAPAMHIDTDEGNAAGIKGVVYGKIRKNA